MNIFQQLTHDTVQHQTRRHFLSRCGIGLGGLWLATQGKALGNVLAKDPANPLAPDLPMFAPKAKRVIYPPHGRRAEPARSLRFQARAASA